MTGVRGDRLLIPAVMFVGVVLMTTAATNDIQAVTNTVTPVSSTIMKHHNTSLCNDSSDDPEFDWYENDNSWWVITFEATLYIVLSVTISCSAVLVITVVWRTTSLHSTPGFLMVIMSACDLLVSIILGSAVVTVIKREFIFGQPINITMAILFAMFQNANAMALMVSAIDQLISILKPLQYHMIVTTRRILIAFTLMTILSLSFVILLTVLAYKQNPQTTVYLDDIVYLAFISVDDAVLAAMSLCLFLLPGAVVTVSYTIILFKVIRARTQIRNQTARRRRGSMGGGLQILSHLKACKMLFIVTLVYFASFLPYMLIDRWILNYPQDLPPIWLYKAGTWLIFVQSMFNCVIFYSMNTHFKKGLAKLVRRVPVLKRCFPQKDLMFAKLSLDEGVKQNGVHHASLSSSTGGRHNSVGIPGSTPCLNATPRPSVSPRPSITPRPSIVAFKVDQISDSTEKLDKNANTTNTSEKQTSTLNEVVEIESENTPADKDDKSSVVNQEKTISTTDC